MTENRKWILKEPVEVPQAFSSAIGGHPWVAQTLYQRGYQTLEAAHAFLDPNRYQPTSADALLDVEIAYEMLAKAIQDGKKILVWGDFDVDGQTSTTLLVQGLRQLGGNVIYHIPIRAKESHGIKQEALKTYLSKGFDLLLTCDTGVSEYDNIQYLQELNIPVIVTDHHALPDKLPPANAIINPQRLSEGHPLRTLPGVGVTYKVIEGLFDYMDRDFEPGPFLELAALGIVADVAELKADTRFLLQKGLVNLRHTNRLGLQTIYENANLNPEYLNEGHIGFQIGPRLNAIGRLGDANPMVEFLLTQDPGRARVIGSQIEATNSKRRFESRQVEKAAEQMLQSSSDDRHAPAIVLHHPAWPGGIVGIVAGHLVEKYQKPTILLTGTDPIHGSARSVTGTNIHQVISEHADLLSNFGGHPMAAGLSLPAENYNSFKHKFLKSVEEAAKFVEAIPVLDIDQELRLDEITMDLVEEIERLSPFGAGFPPLKFLIRDLQLVSHHTVGQNGEHRQALVEDEQGNQQRIIWWNGGDSTLPEAQFDLVCTLSKSDYRGTLQINAEWVDSRLSEKGKVDLAQRQFEIIDHRRVPNPMQILRDEINKVPKSLVWAEVVNLDEIECVTRTDLHPTKNLILLTSPPSQAVLQEALQQTKPNKVIVFGTDPVIKDTDAFLKRVAGLAKFTVNHKDGQAAIDRLAGACAAQREAVLIGLKVWEARGQLTVNFVEEELIIELTQSEPNFAAQAEYLAILTGLLEESLAYRRFFQNSDLISILR